MKAAWRGDLAGLDAALRKTDANEKDDLGRWVCDSVRDSLLL